MTGAIEKRELYIPIRDTEDEYVAVSWDDMPEDPEELMQVFKAELAPLSVWIEAARVYYQQGFTAQYHTILKELVGSEVEEYYAGEKLTGRVQAFCALAEDKVEQSFSTSEPERKTVLLTEASTYLSKATTIDTKGEILELWMAKGQLCLAKGEIREAKEDFSKAAKTSAIEVNNCAGLVGCAYCSFISGKYEEALSMYKKIMMKLGSRKCPEYVRLAMAACFLQLNRAKMAKFCYKQILKFNPQSAEAHAGLASLALLSQSEKDVREGLTLLQKAYEFNPSLSFVLVSLCEQLFARKQFKGVIQIAQAVVNSKSENGYSKAEAHYYLGMVYYILGKLDESMTCFNASIQADQKFIQPKHGLSQIYISQGHISAALAIQEEVNDLKHNDLECLMKLSVLYQLNGDKQKAIQYARKALEIDKSRPLLHEYLAFLLTNVDAKRALDHYEQLSSLQPEGMDKLRLLNVKNNMGVMHYKLNDLFKCLKFFEEALKVGKNSVHSYVVRYNIARTLEALGSHQKAAGKYKQLLTEVPGYYECKLRLAAICFSMGFSDVAIKHCEEAIDTFKNNSECYTMLIWIYLKLKKHERAHKTIKSMQKSFPDDKSFRETALANMYMISADKEARTCDDPSEKRLKLQKYLNYSLMVTEQELKRNPKNIVMAHLFAVCLARLRETDKARRLLSKVEEGMLRAAKVGSSTIEMPEIWQNKGSLLLEYGQYENAVHSYLYCEKRSHSDNHDDISMLVASALEAAGSKGQAARVLVKAIHLSPAHLSLRFNHSKVMTEQARDIIEQPWMTMYDAPERRESDLNFAKSRLKLSESCFQVLAKLDEQKFAEFSLSHKRISIATKKTNLLLVNMNKPFQEVKDYAEIFQKKASVYNKAIGADRVAAIRENEEMKRLEKEEERQRQDEDRAREQEEKLQALKKGWESRKRSHATEDEPPVETGDVEEDVYDKTSVWDIFGDDEEEDEEKEKVKEEPKKKKGFKKPSKRKFKSLADEESDDLEDDFENADSKRDNMMEEEDDDLSTKKEETRPKKPKIGILESDSE